MPSQTAGPYVHIGCIPGFAGIEGIFNADLGAAPFGEQAKGERIEITGAVFDGAGEPLRDAMLESWQADASGIYPGQEGVDPAVSGFCRFASHGETGEFSLKTIKPGAVTDRSGVMAPHINLWIVARGINTGLGTRIYFSDEDNGSDPLLQKIEDKARIKTMVAIKQPSGRYRFDIRLQGDGETVFLDI